MKFPVYREPTAKEPIRPGDRALVRGLSIAAVALVVLVFLFGRCGVALHDDPAEQIEACVSTGKDWVYNDPENEYECVEPGGDD